jgi:hypothetical protein
MALIEMKKLDNPPKEITIPGLDGKPVTVSVRPISDNGWGMVLWALDQINERYQQEVFDVPMEMIKGAAANTAFLESESVPGGSYSWGNDTDNLLIIFEEKVLQPGDEFVVRVLHELMHFMLDESDFMQDISFEARLDLDCYRALGYPIPPNHWALKKPANNPAKPE